MQWAAGQVCGVITWITKEAWEVRQGYPTETCQLRTQSSIRVELGSLFIQKGTMASVPREICKHCPVLFWFIFKSVVGTSFQLLLQVHSTFFKQSIWSSSHLSLISAHTYSSSGLLQCFMGEGKGTSQWPLAPSPASRLALKNLNFRARPVQDLQTETGCWRERAQGRSMRLTLQIKQLIEQFLFFNVAWYLVYNHSTKLHWVISAVLPVSALQKMDFYLQEFKN